MMRGKDFCEEMAQLTETLQRVCQQKEKVLAAGSGITSVELHTLELLDQSGCTMHFLAEELKLSPSRVTRVADNLKRKGLIRRQQGDADRRLCLVEITEKGKERMARGRELLHHFQEQVAGSLSDSEKEQLVASLHRFLSAFNNQRR